MTQPFYVTEANLVGCLATRQSGSPPGLLELLSSHDLRGYQRFRALRSPDRPPITPITLQFKLFTLTGVEQ